MRNGYINEQVVFVSRKTYTVIAKDISTPLYLLRCIYTPINYIHL